MLKIYTIPVSLYSAKLRILLRHKQLQWEELPPPGGYGSDEYKKTVPSGNLPALVDGDLLLADSEVIAEYLNEKHPARPLLPAGIADRAKARERSRFHDTRLEPELRKLFGFLPPETPPSDLVSAQSQAISARLIQLARMLPSKIDRAELSLGDCGFPVTFAWIDALSPVMGLSVDMPDRILEYRSWLQKQPAVAAELKEYGPQLNNWLERERAAHNHR
ncbi:MAG: glutathione S-transferase family protein [Pseudomonadota bacterium]